MSISWGDIDAIVRGEVDDEPRGGGISWSDIDSVRRTSRGQDLAEVLREAGLSREASHRAAIGLADRRYVSIEDAALAERRLDPVGSRGATDERIREVAESCTGQARRNAWGRVVLEGSRKLTPWGRPSPVGGPPSLLERRAPSQVQPRLVESATATAAGEAVFSVCLISAGQGSSGTYPVSTLQEAARAKVFTKGLHCFLDHPSTTEDFTRPERSVRDLAGELDSDATYRDGALYASVRVFSDYREFITERKSSIGMSIRADGEISEGVITRITRAMSVDFVTVAGRGGHIL